MDNICFKNNFLSSIPSLNLLKFHSKSGVPPTLKELARRVM